MYDVDASKNVHRPSWYTKNLAGNFFRPQPANTIIREKYPSDTQNLKKKGNLFCAI